MSFAKSCFSQDLNGNISDLVGLSVIDQSKQFNGQVNACLNVGNTLARIDTLELFQFTRSYFQEVEVNQDVWIGVAQPFDSSVYGPPIPASEAFFVDGNTDNVAFFQEDGVLPWASGQPKFSFEACIEMRQSFDFFWNDDLCTKVNPGLCRGQCLIDDIVAEASTSSCFDNEDGVGQDEFILIDELVNFNALNVICDGFFYAKPARIQNPQELSAATQFLQQNGIDNAFIGVVRNPDIDVNGPSAFQFFDGVQENLEFFQVEIGVEPWDNNEPNNIGDCVQLSVSSGLWSAVSCDSATKGLCRRTCSVELTDTAPTNNPTILISPTTNPSEDSFSEETTSPSLASTNAPTSTLNPPGEGDTNSTGSTNPLEENTISKAVFYLSILSVVILILLLIILLLAKGTQLQKVKHQLALLECDTTADNSE